MRLEPRRDARGIIHGLEEVDARHFPVVELALGEDLAERLQAAFHPEFVAVMVRAGGDRAYRPLVSLPAENAPPPPFAADGKLVGILRVLGKPLEVTHTDAGWLGQRLPSDEAELLRHARVDVLVPIAMTPGTDEALLTLGAKRSEEPYTREDQEFLEAIAASLALLVEQPGAPAAAGEAGPVPSSFQECPACGACYEPSSTVCGAEGAALVRVGAPRTLARCYRLDRRRGHGGMGTVYEAQDGELGRQVAIKLIREDWGDQVEARQRFRREARAGAAFAHPNVVTVHDYGVEGDRYAFLGMELLEGATLGDEIGRCGHLAPDRVVEIFRGVFAAVGAAHQQHLIHRDLKPANIFPRAGRTAESSSRSWTSAWRSCSRSWTTRRPPRAGATRPAVGSSSELPSTCRGSSCSAALRSLPGTSGLSRPWRTRP